jgi:hypothetical protein
MRKRRKILFILISLAGIILCLSIILLVVTPQLINLNTVKEKIKSEYTKNIGGQIEYAYLKMVILPRPRVIISDVKFTIPEKVDGTLESLDIYPKILPLFTGNLRIAMLRSRSPRVNIRFPDKSDDESKASDATSADILLDRLISVIRSLPELKIPTIVLRIKNGRTQFFEGKKRIFILQSINGNLKRSANRFEFDFKCQSNFWESMAMKGRYEEPGFQIKSQIKLNHFRPHALIDTFLPPSALKITNAPTNLTLDLQTDGPERLQANLKGSIPSLNLRHGNKDLKLTDASFEGECRFNNKIVTVSLSQLNLSDPRLSLSGQLQADPSLPGVQLELEGRQIDVETTQRIALALTENTSKVDEVFKIMRSGIFQRVTLKARGPTLAELADGGNYVIAGDMVGGKIFVPNGQLNLVDVTGDAKITNGILEGENIEARMGNSSATEGKLAIPLTDDTAPFHIEALIQADLSQLPPVLTRLIDDDVLKKELAHLDKFAGSAVGMLVLGDDTKDINVKVMASDIQLDAAYKRIPYPIKIGGGNFLLDGSRIELTNLNAMVGKSSLSRFSSKFDWEKTSSLKISSQSAAIDLAQLYAWLSEEKKFRQQLKEITAISGTVALKKFNLSGPLLKPDKWQIQSKGSVQKLSMRSELLPGTLSVVKGHFNCKGDQIFINNLNANVGNSSFTGLSARLKWGPAMMLTANSEKTVVFLDEVYPWLKSRKALKNRIKDVPTLTGRLAFQELAFEGPITGITKEKLNLIGRIDNWDIHSPTFPTSINVTGGQLEWHGTRIDLQNTDASFGASTITQFGLGIEWGKTSSYEIKADSADIQIAEFYPWLISFKTLRKMFQGYTATGGKLALTDLFLKGPVGPSKTWRFDIAGDLNAFVMESDYFKEPMHINTTTFAAKDTKGSEGIHGHIDLTDTQMSWEDSRITLQGKADFSENELILDLDLAANRISWSQIDQIAKLEKSQEPDSSMALLGELRVISENFVYDRYTWQSMHADISFNKADISIVIKKADLCGIQFPGILKVASNQFEFYFNPVTANQNLEPSISCLTDKKDLIDGIFSLNGELLTKARPSDFPKSLLGNVDFTAEQGRIYRFGMLAKIFALLNVTEIYRGEVPDLAGKGFAYNSMSAKAVFEDGKLIFKEGSIDSPSMGIAIEGHIDLIKKKMNLTVLVAPFKTVDRIVKHIPLVSNVLGGKLISIPFKAVGELGDPDVIPLSPTAVGSGLLGILQRTLELPITIIQPVLPGSKDEEKQKNQRILQ